MAFNQRKLDIATFTSRKIFNSYVYLTDDTAAETQETDYFIENRFAGRNPDIWTGSYIRCKCSDGTYDGLISSNGTVVSIGQDEGGIQNRVVVNSISDFPAPISNVINLSPSTEYYIGSNNIDIGINSFNVPQNVVITGAPGLAFINSTTSAPLFTNSTNIFFFTIRGVIFNCPNCLVFEISDNPIGQSFLFVTETVFFDASGIGSIDDILAINFSNNSMQSLDSGLAVSGAFDVISIMDTLISSESATFVGIDLGSATVSGFEMEDIFMSAPVGAIGVSGLPDNGNIPPPSIARIGSCEFIGGINALSGISVDDVAYVFSNNSGIDDTHINALITLNGNAIETVIPSADTPVKVSGVWNQENSSHFTTDASGTITFNGRSGKNIPIDINLSSTITGGGTDNTTFYLALNGVVIINSGVSAAHNATNVTNTSIIWDLQLQEGDFLELFAENNSDSSNIIVQRSTFRVL